MATWTDTTTMDTAPDAPVTSELMTALRDNPVAIAEGAVGATPVSGVYELVEIQEPTSDVSSVIFSTDISQYYSVRVECVFEGSTAANQAVSLDIGTAGGTWYTVQSNFFRLNDVTFMTAEIHNANNNDNTDLQIIRSYSSLSTTGLNRTPPGTFGDINVLAAEDVRYSTLNTALTQIRVAGSVGLIQGADADDRGVFRMWAANSLTRQVTS